jgi:hypothetical protein
MQKKQEINAPDKRLMERLNAHPQLKSRLEAILELAESEGGELPTVDEIEELLIEELRRLGNQTMQDWASGAHALVAAEMKSKDPSCYPGKKNAEVVRFWTRGSAGVDLAQPKQELFAGVFGSDRRNQPSRSARLPPRSASGPAYRLRSH